MVSAKARQRACGVCVWEGRLLCVRLRDPATGARFLVPPGGLIEADETPGQAAVRETREETGYEVALTARSPVVARYPFTWNGQPMDVTTYFQEVVLVEPGAPPALVSDAAYLEASQWIPLAEVQQVLGFHPAILHAVVQLLADAGYPLGVPCPAIGHEPGK